MLEIHVDNGWLFRYRLVFMSTESFIFKRLSLGYSLTMVKELNVSSMPTFT